MYWGWFVIIGKIISVIALIALGWLMSSLYAVFAQNMPIVSNNDMKTEQTVSTFLFSEPKELPDPFDRIKEEKIHVYPDRVVIDLPNAEWASFTDTNSMDPVIDLGSNAIELVPNSPDDVHVGDIVSYQSKYASGTIIHRVIEIGSDKSGWYCRMKGDNVDTIDPGLIRFDQIRRVVVAIIY
ncbi:MAG: hypothetical protein V1837_05390 [Candidatus Woesearchaeota archaeon]